MVLSERAEVPPAATNVFLRRALWESAIVSYGRMAVSEKRRKLDHEELLRTARGDRGIEFHELLMGWRHDHVGHRLSRELESIDVYVDYLDADPSVLDSVRVAVSPSGGPPDNSPFAVEFREHVTALRDVLWERYLAPIGEVIARQLPTGTPMPTPAESSERVTVEQTLWARSNDTGMG
jgi:hypothetical protein